MGKTEYFVYCGFFITHYWTERFVQIPKGEFFEVPLYLMVELLFSTRVEYRNSTSWPLNSRNRPSTSIWI